MTRVALLACLLAAAFAISAHGQSAQEPVVFDVGNTQDIDNMNPLVGVSVPSYEAWNLQYEQLVGKAAKDFAPVPGLATEDEFRAALAAAGFEGVTFRDLTTYIVPSARRLFVWGAVGTPTTSPPGPPPR